MHAKSMVVGVVVGAVVAGSVAAWAAIPHSQTGAVTLCVTSTGTVRVIDAEAGKTCKTTERTVTVGAKGATGPAGATGVTGATGPAGSGYVVVDGDGNTVGTFIAIQSPESMIIDTANGPLSYSPYGYLTVWDDAPALHAPYWTNGDCTGDPYYMVGTPDPFGTAELFSNVSGYEAVYAAWRTHDPSTAISGAAIHSRGIPGDIHTCHSGTGGDVTYEKYATPFLIDSMRRPGPLRVVPAG